MRQLTVVRCSFGLLIAYCVTSHAREKQFSYNNDQSIYALTFDDARIPAAEMRRIAWLSPFVQFDAKSPFVITSSNINGIIDKHFSVPPLEQCNPGYSDCMHPVLNAAFLKNAALNLDHGKMEVAILKSLKIPSVLEPVRAYLLSNLEFFLQLEQARYTYLSENDPKPLRYLLCKYCKCTAVEEGLLDKLNTAAPSEKLHLSRFEWYNAVLRCHRSARETYLLNAWKRFVKEYGIREKEIYIDIE